MTSTMRVGMVATAVTVSRASELTAVLSSAVAAACLYMSGQPRVAVAQGWHVDECAFM
jgi:hypothetical protein